MARAYGAVVARRLLPMAADHRNRRWRFDPEKNQMADSVMALSPKDLKLADYFTPRNRAWMTKKDLDMGSIGPTIFNFKNWELAATSGKEGVIFLLDTKSYGGRRSSCPALSQPASSQ